jgi:hypothetical protein
MEYIFYFLVKNPMFITSDVCYQFLFIFQDKISFNKIKTKLPYVYICIFHYLD